MLLLEARHSMGAVEAVETFGGRPLRRLGGI